MRGRQGAAWSQGRGVVGEGDGVLADGLGVGRDLLLVDGPEHAAAGAIPDVRDGRLVVVEAAPDARVRLGPRLEAQRSATSWSTRLSTWPSVTVFVRSLHHAGAEEALLELREAGVADFVAKVVSSLAERFPEGQADILEALDVFRTSKTTTSPSATSSSYSS